MSTTKKTLIVLGGILLALLLLLAGALLFLRWQIGSKITHIPEALPEVSVAEEVEGDQVNILVMGSDSRESGGDPTDWTYGGQRSDSMMLVQIAGNREHVNIMSLPRDSWVEVPGNGKAKINAAFSWGGAPLTIQTVEQVTGIPIDHIAIVDFTGFEELTNQLGGVTIETKDGPVTMNGERALEFVRERYTLPSGDFDRMRRQQAWMKAIMQRVLQRDVLTSPTQIYSLTQTLLENSAVDEGMTVDYLTGLAFSLRDLRAGDVNFFTAPYAGIDMTPDGQSIVLLDEDGLALVTEAWRNDEVHEFLQSGVEVETLGSRPIE